MESYFSLFEQDGGASEFELLTELLLDILNDFLGGSVGPLLGLLFEKNMHESLKQLCEN